MKTNYIKIRPDRLNFPLAPCSVGRASSAVFTIYGDIPDDIAALIVRVEYQDGNDETQTYDAAGKFDEASGSYRVYLAPSYFPAASETLKYHVIGTDTSGNPRWLGTGVLRILDNPANGSSSTPSILPAGSYAYNPDTGLYYKLIAEVNELGEISVSVSQEGVEL